MSRSGVERSSETGLGLYPLGRHIAVFGKGGKTTLARAMARKFDLEFVELDAIRHLARWEERADDETRDVLISRIDAAESGWVTDGNYRVTRDLILDRADTVVVLALPWKTMVWRTLKRSLIRSFTRQELWNGNRESIRATFFSRQSVVYDLWFRRHHFRTIAEEFLVQKPQGVELLIIRTSEELENLYRDFDLIRD